MTALVLALSLSVSPSPIETSAALGAAEQAVAHMAALVRPGCPERGWPQGRAVVRVTVNAAGRVVGVKIAVTTADADLDAAALDAVRLVGSFAGTPRTFDVPVAFDAHRLSAPVKAAEADLIVGLQERDVTRLAQARPAEGAGGD